MFGLFHPRLGVEKDMRSTEPDVYILTLKRFFRPPIVVRANIRGVDSFTIYPGAATVDEQYEVGKAIERLGDNGFRRAIERRTGYVNVGVGL